MTCTPKHLTFLFSACLLAYALNAYSTENNTQRCGEQFAASDFTNPKIPRLIKKLKHSDPIDPGIAKKLAAFGPPVVPYLSRLACDRKLHISFAALLHTGQLAYYSYYWPHAVKVIENISDPAAIPNLKKVLTDTMPVRQGAQDAIIRLSAQTNTGTASIFSPEVIKRVIQEDAKSYLVVYNLSRYLKMMKDLPHEKQAEVLLYLFDRNKIAPLVSFETGDNIHNLSDFELDTWAEIVRLLGRTRDSRALELLGKQYKGLSGALAHWEKETSKSYSLRYIDKLSRIIAVYKEALREANVPLTNAVNNSYWGLPLNYTIKCTPGMPKTLMPKKAHVGINIDGQPLIDGNKRNWSGVPVDVTTKDQGDSYNLRLNITWAAKPTESFRPIGYVEMSIDGCESQYNRLAEAIPR